MRFSTFNLATLIVKGCDLLLDRESCKIEYKHTILKNEHLANLKHPQSSMEPLNRREPDDYKSSVNTRFAMIHFSETGLYGCLELERGAIWFLDKEPSH